MTEDQLNEGKRLSALITSTSNALKDVSCLVAKPNAYYLTISENRDGSGVRATCNRAEGNKELLTVIEAELKRQLNSYEEQFAAL